MQLHKFKYHWGAICLITVLSLVMYGCGGGGGSRVEIANVNLGGLMLAANTPADTVEIAAGDSVDRGGITFTCPAGGNACTLKIAADGTVTSTGGVVTAMATTMIPEPTEPTEPTVHVITLPDAPMVPEGVTYEVPETTLGEAVTIEAGDMRTEGYVTFTCPAGGDACIVAQAEDDSFTSTGGMATVMVADSVIMSLNAAIADKAETDRLAAVEHTVDISELPPEYNTITQGNYTVEAGGSLNVGDAKFICPAGPVACNVSVTTTPVTGDDGITVMVTEVISMGGEATVASSDDALASIEMDRIALLEARMHVVDMSGIEEDYGPTPGTYDIAAGATESAGNVDFTCSAGEVNCVVVVANDGTVTNTGGAAMASQSDAGLAAIRRDAEAARIAKETAARVEAMRVEALIDPDATLADYDSATDGNQAIVTLTEEDTATAGKTAVAGVVAFEDDEPANQDDANRFVMSGTPAPISGWKGGTYTRTNDDTVHTVVKYNNKADDGAEDYAAYFGVANRPGVTGVADTTVPGQLTLATTTDTGSHELFSLNFGITAPLQTVPASLYDDPKELGTQHDNPATEAAETTSSWTGMFAGVTGTFTCSGATCTASSDADGNLSSLAGDWTFRPAGSGTGGHAETDDLDDIMVEGVVPDADFMIFGYWEQAVTDDDGDTEYSMLPIADGKRDYGPVDSVLGTATYTGPATGLYMRNSLTPDGQPTDPFTSGQFTANAELNANFGGGDVAPNNAFSVTGTISNFMDGGTVINDQWVVNLNRRMLPGTDTVLGTDDDEPQRNIGDLTAAGHRDGTVAGTFDGETDGGPLGSAAGSWSGTFHGGDDDTTTGVEAPNSASGVFDGHFSNGHVRGAFAVD